MKMMKRLLVICGPTATGKTSLGVKLAKKFDGEIISADSRQVYRGMDIGTGKDVLGAKWVNSPFPRSRRQQARHLGGALELKALSYKTGYYEIDGVKVWLLDMVEPDYQFTVADYVRCTEIVIEDIWKRKKLPILVGGTGFYIKAVVDGIGTMGIPQDKKLRQELSNCQIVKLSNLLKKTDKEKWERMNESDRKNLRRLVRAIEVARKAQNFHLRGVPACHRLAAKQLAGRHSATSQVVKQIPNFEIKADNVLFIGLTANNKVLYERIDRRVDERVKQGIVKEIQGLLKKGYSWENSALGVTIGYKEWRDCFAGSRFKAQGSRPEEEAIQRWKYAEHKYARRQMTWFKKDKRIQWIDITNKKWQDDSKELVESWLSQGTCRKK